MSEDGRVVGKISIKVSPDMDGFRRELKTKLDEIEKSTRGEAKVSIDLDTSEAMAKYQVFRQALKDVGSDAAKIKLKPDIEFGRTLAEWKAVKAAISRDAKIDVDVRIDKNRFQQTLSGIGDKISNLFSGGGGSAVGGSKFGGLGSFADSAVMVAAVAAILAPALALVSGVLVSLPGLFAALLVPIGAVALGMDGLKKAAGVLKPDLDALKATMSQRFQDVFTPIFQSLRSVFPTLQQALPGVADGLGAMAKSLVDVVKSPEGLERIKSSINNIAETLKASAPGVGKFTDGLLTLVDKVTGKFPEVGKWLDTVGDSFEKWIAKVTKPTTGNGPHGGVSELDTALSNLGETLKGIGSIGVDILSKGFDFLKDPEFGDKMQKFVDNVKDFVNNTLPQLKTLFEDIATIVDKVATSIDKINTFGGGQKPKPNEVSGQAGIFPGFLTGPGTPIGDTKNSFQATVAELEGMLVPVWVNLKQKAAETVNSIVTTLGSIPSRLGSTWNGMVSTVEGAMARMLGAVIQKGGEILNWFAGLPGKVVAALGNLAGALIGAGASLMAGLYSGIVQGFEKVKSFVSGIKQWIIDHKGPVTADAVALTPAGQALMQGLGDGIQSGFEPVMTQVTDIAGRISDAFNQGIKVGDSKELSDQLDLVGKNIDLEESKLKLKMDQAGDNKDLKSSIKGELDKLGIQKDQLDISRKQLDVISDSNKESKSLATSLGEAILNFASAGGKAPFDFAKATGQQAMSDLGIGGGALTALGGQALQLGEQFIFNVSNWDEAYQIKQKEQNKRALQWTGR